MTRHSASDDAIEQRLLRVARDLAFGQRQLPLAPAAIRIRLRRGRQFAAQRLDGHPLLADALRHDLHGGRRTQLPARELAIEVSDRKGTDRDNVVRHTISTSARMELATVTRSRLVSRVTALRACAAVMRGQARSCFSPRLQ